MLRRLPAALLVIALELLTAIAAAQTPVAADWGIEQLMQSLAQVKSARGRFVERKTLAILNSPLEFSGRQASSMPGSSITMGASWMTEAAVKPFSRAAEYRNGLKPEPGWRRACVARLNLPIPLSK